MSLQGRVALITGASSGIGRAVSLQLAAQGVRVGLVARRRDALEELQSEIIAAGGQAASAIADVRQANAVQQAALQISAQLGPVDLLVASAGYAPTEEAIEPLNPAEISQIMAVNYLGVVHSVAAVLPEMLKRPGGQIAAISSLASYRGLPGNCGYSASKAAVNLFLESLRVELQGRGVCISTICPGYVDTPMTAGNGGSMPFLLSAAAAARRIVWAIERRKTVYNFPWQTALLIKLARLCPDWLVARLAPREQASQPPAKL